MAVTGSRVSSLFNDSNGDGKVSPGDTLLTQIFVNNTNATPLTTVVVNDSLTSGTTYVAGSIVVTTGDSYAQTGNTPQTYSAASGLLANDKHFDGTNAGTNTGLTVVSVNTAGTQGAVAWNADGSFTFTPTTGFVGTTSFTYNISDDGSHVVGTGTVNIAVSGLVWYVDSAAASGGADGSYDHPFTTLAPLSTGGSADALDGANDIIFVYNRGATYTGGIVLETGQKLYGDGHEFQVNGHDIGVTGVTTGPTISYSGAGVTLNSGNTIDGLNLSGTAAGAVGIIDNGSSTGTLTVSNVAVSGQGRIVVLDHGGTLNVTLNSASSTGASGTPTIDLETVQGSFTVTGATSITGTGTQGAVNATFSSGVLAVDFKGNFTGNVNTGATTVAGIVNFASNANGSSITFEGTNNNITAYGGSGGIAVSELAGTSTLNALNGGLHIVTAAGTGLDTSGTGTALNIGGVGNTITTATGTIVSLATTVIGAGGATFDTLQTTGTSVGNGLGFSSVSGGAFTSTTTNVVGAAANGIAVSNTNSNISLGTGAIGSVTGQELSMNGGTGNLTYNGTLTKTSDGLAVQIQNKTGGTVALGGAISSTSSSDGISMTNNTGATINYTGQLTLNTSASNTDAFTATGGGTISSSNASSTITAGNGSAINVANTNIGTNNLVFQSVSSIGGSKTGIILDGTGSAGGLHISGTGSAGTGGTIANKSGSDGQTSAGIGIYLHNTTDVQLNWMQLNDFQNFGIRGLGVSGFSMNHVIVNGSNGTAGAFESYGEGSVSFGKYVSDASYENGVTGIVNITNSTITGAAAGRNLGIVNTSGATALTITNVNFGTTTSANTTGSNLAIEARGNPAGGAGSQMNILVSGSTFTGAAANQAAFVNQVNSGTMNVTFSGNTLTDNHPSNIIGGGGLFLATAGAMNFNVASNSIKGADGSAITVQMAAPVNGDTGARTLNGTLNSNTIGTVGVADSASKSGNGIFLSLADNSTLPKGSATIAITNNNIYGYHGNAGIYDDNTGGNYDLNLTVTGNTVGGGNASNSLYGIAVTAGQPSSTQDIDVFLKLSGNDFSIGDPNNANDIIVGVSGSNSSMTLSGASATDVSTLPNIQTFLKNSNNLNNASGATNVIAYKDPGAGPYLASSGSPPLPTAPTVPLLLSPDAPAAPATPSDTVVGDKPVGDPPVDTGGETGGGQVPGDTGGTTPPAPAADGLLTQSQLDTLVSAAIDRWAAAGATADQIAAMKAVSVTVVDMAGLQIGGAATGYIHVDNDGGGYGWFIDQTPGEDSEFSGTGTDLTALASGPAAGHVDLLTVLEHELGHQIGLADRYDPALSADLMYGYINPGERRLPSGDDVHAATNTPVDHEAFAVTSVNIGTLPATTTLDVSYKSTVNAFSAGLTPTLSGTSTVTSSSPTITMSESITRTNDTLVNSAGTSTTQSLAIASLTLGDLVFKDNNKNGVFDLGDAGIGNVTVKLYIDNGSTAGSFDATDTFVTSMPTSAGGVYSFAGLAPGDYIVVIPSTNFASGAALNGLVVHAGAIDPDTGNVDNDNNGAFVGPDVASKAITLSYDMEGPAYNPAGAAGNDTNNTLDFGFQTNVAPTAAPDSKTVAEDSGATTINVLGNDSDADNGDTFSVTAVGAAAHGTVAITNGGADLTYTPTANYYGTDSFTYTVTDNHGASSQATVSMTVTAVNDPVTGTVPATFTINEDAALTAVTGMSIADVDTALAPAGVYEATLSAGHGVLTLTTITNLTFTAGDGTADPTMTFHGTLADINTALATAKYKPDANYNGADGITLAVTDTFGGTVATGSGSATSDSDTIAVTVNSVNDAPSGADESLHVFDDVSHVFTVAEFTAGYTDIDGDALKAVKVDTLPATGTLKLNGTLVTMGQTVLASDIGAGKLVFTPDPASGGTAPSFKFQVQDAGGTLNGGVDLDPVQHVFTLNVDVSNLPPTAVGDSLTAYEDQAAVYSEATLLAGDSDPDAGDTIRVTGARNATHGTVSYNSTTHAVTFTPTAGYSGPASFDYTITDSHGATSTATETVTVAPTNDAPTIANLDGDTNTQTEDQGYYGLIDTGGDALVADIDSADFDGGNLTVSIASWNGTDSIGISQDQNVTLDFGTLEVSVGGVVIGVASGGYINQTGTFTVTFNANANPSNVGELIHHIFAADNRIEPVSGTRTVNISLTDGDGTAHGGTDTSTYTTTFTVVAINDEPSGADKTVTTNEDVPYTFATADFGFYDGGSYGIAEGQNLQAVKITTLPAAGILYLDADGAGTGSLGTAITAGQMVSASDIAAGHLVYVPAANASGTGVASFTFQVQDDGGTSNGGQDTDQSPNTIMIDVNNVNDAPTYSGATFGTGDEDGSITFSIAGSNAIVIGDIDGSGPYTATLTVAHGVLAATASGAAQVTGTGSGTVTVTGTLAEVNATLDGLTYTPAGDFNGPDTLHISTKDSGGTDNNGVDTGTTDIALTVNPMNDAPTVVNGTTASAATIAEDTPGSGQTVATLFGGHFSDATDQVTGGSSANAFAGVAVTGNDVSGTTGQWEYYDGAAWVAVGTVSDGSALLLDAATLVRFHPAQDYNGAAPALTVHLVDDSAGSIPAGAVADLSALSATGGTTAYSTGTVDLGDTVTAVDDNPVLTATGTSFDYTENDPQHALFTTLAISDVDNANFNNGTLSFVNASGDPGDGIAFAPNPDIVIDQMNGTVAYQGHVFATLAPSAPGSLLLNLNSYATPAAVEALLGVLQYVNDSDDPVGGDHAITVTLTDGSGGTGSYVSHVNVIPVNDAPTFGKLNGNFVTYTEDGPPVKTDFNHDATLSDPDNHNYNGATLVVSVSGNKVASEDQLVLVLPSAQTPNAFSLNAGNLYFGSTQVGTVTGGGVGQDLNVSFTSATTDAPMVQLLLREIGYQNTNHADPSTAQRTIAYTITDPSSGVSTVHSLVNVTAVNDPPVNGVPAGTQSVNEDATLTFSSGNSNAITVSDADVGNGTLTTTVSVLHGNLAVSTQNNLVVTGQGSTSVQLTGAAADINAALSGLTYKAFGNYNGGDTLTVLTSDGGNTGTGGTKTDTDTVAITVSPVNDQPVVTASATAAETEQTAVVLNPNWTVSDVDLDAYNGGNGDYAGASLAMNRSGGANTQDTFGFDTTGASFTVSGSNLQSGGQTFATFSTSGGVLQINFTSTGTAATTALVNNVLDHIQYTNTSDAPPLSVQLIYAFNDGAPGHGQGLVTSFSNLAGGQVTVNIAAVDDAPANVVPIAQTLVEDGSKTFSTGNSNAITVSDVDVGGGTLTVTLSVGHGTLALGSTSNVSVSGNTSGTVQVTGTPANLNAVLNGLVYTPAANFNGDDALHVVTSDNSNTGTGGPLSDTDDIVLHVTAVNDAPVASGSATAATINEDTPGAGETVASLFAGNFSDAKDQVAGGSTANGLAGVAVTANASSNAAGHWQYYDGASWTDIPTGASNSAAVVLSASTLVRFNPAKDYNGQAPALTVHLIDDSAGAVTSGSLVDLSAVGATGGTSAYSAGTVDLHDTVTAVNDPPVLDLDGGSNGFDTSGNFAEGDGPLHLAPNGIVTDVDSPDFAGATLTVAFTGGAGAYDQLLVIGLDPDAGGQLFNSGGDVIASVAGGADPSDPLVITFTSFATAADVQDVLHMVGFADYTNAVTAGDRTISFTLTDGDGGTSNVATATLHVTAVDSPATLGNDAVTTDELTAVSIAVLSNDTDPDGPPPAVMKVNNQAISSGQTITLPSGAKLTLNSDGTLTYDPNHQFDTLTSPAGGETGASNTQASDGFTYTTQDGSTASVSVTVTGVANAADHLEGSSGNDVITGTSGSDYFDLSQGGSDTATGHMGNDAFYFGAAYDQDDKVKGGLGNDTVGLRGDYTGGNKVNILGGNMLGVETISLMTSAGSPVGYDITWKDGNLAAGQKLIVYAGNLAAGENVTFDGSAETHGFFVMYGGSGHDTMTGGANSDGFYFGPGKFDQNDHVDGGGGTRNQLGLDGSYNFSAASALGTLGGNFTNIQTIVLYNGNPLDMANPYPNTYHIETNNAAVAAGQMLTIYGTPVTTSIYFNGSAETDGAFTVYGGTVGDTIVGGAGADILFGGLGADTLTGGGGNDSFLYTLVSESGGVNTDRITDFTLGDFIDLSQIDADTTQAGDQAFTFLGSSLFTNHAGELRAEFDAAHNVWTVQADVDGDGVADMSILVTTSDNHILTSADFHL